jgi:hypothetical protein
VKLLGAALGFLGCMLLWALAEALSDLLGDAASAAVAPAWRPVWRMFLRSRWPWPALLMAALGVAGVIAGFRLHERYDPGWRGVAALLLYFVGGAVAVVAPFLWRDARRVRAREAAQASGQSPSQGAA